MMSFCIAAAFLSILFSAVAVYHGIRPGEPDQIGSNRHTFDSVSRRTKPGVQMSLSVPMRRSRSWVSGIRPGKPQGGRRRRELSQSARRPADERDNER
jgi:hypothetical protein